MRWVGTNSYAAGEVGQGFAFNGTNYLVVTNTSGSLGPTNAVTIEAWVWISSGASGTRILTLKGSPQGWSHLLALDEPGNTVYGLVESSYLISSTASLSAETWHHIAMTYNATNGVLGLYIDGQPEEPLYVPDGLVPSAPTFFVGGNPDSTWPWLFTGRIDEPAVYHRVLDALEIQTIYNAGAAGKHNANCVTAPADVVAWWPGDGHGYDLARTNLATLSNATYESAEVAQGFSFNGTSSSVTAAGDQILNLGANDDVTIEAWIKPLANTTTYGVMSIAGKRYSPNSSSATGYELFLANGTPGFQIASASGPANFIGTNYLIGGYHHVAVTMDRDSTNGGKLYVDGTSVLTFDPTVVSGSLSNSAPFRIGVHPQNGFNGWYKGVIDEVTVYRRALAGSEITTLYAAGGAGKCQVDADEDGLTDLQESFLGTDPEVADSDDDGLTDGDEIFVHHTNPNNADEDSDDMIDGWEILHFGNLSQPPNGENGDYDNDGATNLEEYHNGSDPNTIMCVVRSETDNVNSNNVPILLEALHGVPNKMAILVNSTNFDNAVWSNFNPNLVVYLGTQDGKYDVWIAVSNRTSLQASGWERHTFYRDTVSPLVLVENPVAVISRPVIQVEGYCPELIGSLLSYDVFNAEGDLTNQMAYVKNQFFDTNQMTITTNWWQCYDVRLVAGTNTIVVRAFDKAGNGGVATNVVFFDVSSDTDAPVMELHWPQNGDLICGTSFTLRGWLDDPTARVIASIADSNGLITQVEGLAERNGILWVEGLPVSDGTNSITLTTTDVAGNTATTNIIIVKGDLEVVMNDLPDSELPTGVITIVSGTVSDTNYTVWVNGVRATMDGNNWSAENVPLNEGGTAVVQARAIPNTDNGGNGSGGGGGGGAGGAVANPSSPNSATKEADKELGAYIRIASFEDIQKIVMKPPDDGSDITEINRVWQHNKPSTATWKNTWLSPNYLIVNEAYSFPADQAAIGIGGPSKPGTRTVTWTPPGTSTTLTQTPWPIPLWHYDFHLKNALRRPPADRIDVDWTVNVKLELVTGGKARSSRMNLFQIAASGSTTEDDRPTGWALKPGMPIPATSIKVFGKTLFSDGVVFIPFADNTTNPFTVEAPFKNYSFSVNQQKYRLKSVTHACKPDDHERRTVGVGEEVNLFFVVPGLNPESPAVPADWSTSGGSVTPANGLLTKFTAPSNAANATVTATYRGARVPALFEVLAPTGIESAIRIESGVQGKDSYNPPYVGAGMYLNVFLKPRTVSFYRVQIKEPAADAIDKDGYFLNNPVTPNHDAAHFADQWHPVNCDNKVVSGAFDHAYSFGWPLNATGKYTWPISPIWSIEGTGPTHPLNGWTPQVHTLTSGTMRVDKLGHHVVRGQNQQGGGTAQ